MTKILLTGFEPFAGAATNSSGDAVEVVRGRWSGTRESANDELVVARLPVVFAQAGVQLLDLVAEHTPDVVIATGLANGRSSVTPERVAINLEDARIPDNAGDQPTERSIETSGPAAYWSGLPVAAISAAISGAGIPSSVSTTAGTYVCNSVMYRLLASVRGSGVAAGFIHVPSSPRLAEGTSDPFLEVDEIARALEIAIETTVGELQRRTL